MDRTVKKWLPSLLVTIAMITGTVGAFVVPNLFAPANDEGATADAGAQAPIAVRPDLLLTDAGLREQLVKAGVDLSDLPELAQSEGDQGLASVTDEKSPQEIFDMLKSPEGQEPGIYRASVPLMRMIEDDVANDASPTMAVEGTLDVEVRTKGTSDPGSDPRPMASDVDAGGPYGGPDCFEGTCVITFTATVTDPTLIAFRWDFNNDGKMDTDWLFTNTYSISFDDNYFGDIVVEAWDTVSYRTVTLTATNFNENTAYQWNFIFWMNYNLGYQFRAKDNLRVTELGFFRTFYTMRNLKLWDPVTRTLLTECTPTNTANSWNWCILSTPFNLVAGNDYILTIHVAGFILPGIDKPQPNEFVIFDATYYCFGAPSCFPGTRFVDFAIPDLDMRFQYQRSFPDTQSDSAFLQVENVAPSVFDATATAAFEGSEAFFSAKFSDPGTGDDWWSRVDFGDGTFSDWMKVRKFDGGAKVALLHSWNFDIDSTILPNLIATCGNWCVTIDPIDIGPFGSGNPTLEELLAYDVVLTGTNYGALPDSNGLGDLLADYMDEGKSVVAMAFVWYGTNFWGIGGRWQSGGYSPLGRTTSLQFGTVSLGTIYVPGHPLFDGVTTASGYYKHNLFTVASGATRIADYTNARVFAAEKAAPSGSGAIAVALNYFPVLSSGDAYQIIVNALKYASGIPEVTLKQMPITLEPVGHAYADDNPTTTLEDQYPFRVEVRDDDHGLCVENCREQLVINEAITGEGFLGTADAVEIWNFGSKAVDMTGWTIYFQDNRGSFFSPTYAFKAGRTIMPGKSLMVREFSGTDTADTVYTGFNIWWVHFPPFGGSGSLIPPAGSPYACDFVRWNTFFTRPGCAWTGPNFVQDQVVYRNQDDDTDDSSDWSTSGAGSATPNELNRGQTGVITQPPNARILSGLGDAPGMVTVMNAPPLVVGGAISVQIDEADTVSFQGYTLQDPALMEDTEWFAYQWDFDDGTVQPWVYKGTMTPPKLKVLILHSACNPGESCPPFNTWKDDIVKNLRNVDVVDTYNYFNPPRWPTLSFLLQYDVIFVTSQWGWFFNPLWDTAREMISDMLADYVDAGRGGVLTYCCTLETIFGLDIWRFTDGRFVAEDYAPYESGYTATAASKFLGEILVPEHDLVQQFVGDLESYLDWSGQTTLTADARVVAKWDNGHPVIGVKDLTSVAHFSGLPIQLPPSYRSTLGEDFTTYNYNAICWSAGTCPSPKITAIDHQFGDNGVFDVTLRVIDDDMGYVWDFAAGAPMAALPQAFTADRVVPTSVDNTEPVIESIQAFIAARFCVRVSGTAGNSVTLGVYTDGLLSSTMTTVRMSGDPNPPSEKCALVNLDVRAPHSYEARLTYSAPMGGSNPTWLIISPWREPITPGHGTITYKYSLDATTSPTVTQPLPTLKADLLASGRGAMIDFVVQAFDRGTDDLAVFYVWGTPGGTPYAVPNLATSVYTIHVHHNDGRAMTDGTLAGPQNLGFSEPWFDKVSNDQRSALGRTNFRIVDSAVHGFNADQPIVYVVIIVMDDDVGDPYPSNFMNPGIDMEFFVLHLR